MHSTLLDPTGRKAWLLYAAALAAHALAFLVLIQVIAPPKISGINLFFEDAGKIQAGQAPYRDFLFEYPPLAAPLVWLPILLGNSLGGYRTAFAWLMGAFDLAGVCAAVWGARRLALPGSIGWLIALQPLMLVALGRDLVVARFDLAPAALTLWALVLFATAHRRLGWTTLALATAVKLYPLVLAPLFAWSLWRQRARRELAAGLALFALTLLVSALAVTRGDPRSLQTFLAYHGGRGLEIESLYSSLLLIEPLSGHNEDAFGHFVAYGSEELNAPAAPWVAGLALPITAVVLAIVYARYALTEPESAGGPERFARLAQYSALAILAFMLAGKVLSPQYLLWLFPFAGMLGNANRVFGAFMAGVIVPTHWNFPDHWGDLLALEPLPVLVLLGRNALLVALGVVLFVRGRAARPVDAGRETV